jgi:hypothetical protein
MTLRSGSFRFRNKWTNPLNPTRLFSGNTQRNWACAPEVFTRHIIWAPRANPLKWRETLHATTCEFVPTEIKGAAENLK